jgi:hypothetical protein
MAKPLTEADIEAILHSSHCNNTNNYITGLLCFNKQYFIQCLEGARTEVSRTYQRISHDRRHKNIQLLHLEEISARDFPE